MAQEQGEHDIYFQYQLEDKNSDRMTRNSQHGTQKPSASESKSDSSDWPFEYHSNAWSFF